ncbi:hypothetical protein F2Q70_00044456 [Brassica cretica]|uniref:Uncharacterized protein n=1 Tax=Brassica cretica TaxID=69181 RepID=A0A8S9KPE4_BRACR|nr:hypothetical protein F2Q70_00044456 [Brassica cretica]
MWDVSGAQRRSPVVLCPRRSEAGQANGESGADASRVKWRSRDGPALRVLIAELDEHFPLVSSVLIAEAEGRVVVRGAVPAWGWFSAVARPGVLRRCSFGDLGEGSEVLHFDQTVLRHWLEGGQQEKSFLRFSEVERGESQTLSRGLRKMVSAQCGWSHCLNPTFTVSKPLIITFVVFFRESMRLMDDVAIGCVLTVSFLYQDARWFKRRFVPGLGMNSFSHSEKYNNVF